MTNDELEQLLEDIESDRVERKESLTDGDKIRQAICAFANDLPSHNSRRVVCRRQRQGRSRRPSDHGPMLQNLASMRGDG
jgi:ATP-dependent DNA helicase RecG